MSGNEENFQQLNHMDNVKKRKSRRSSFFQRRLSSFQTDTSPFGSEGIEPDLNKGEEYEQQLSRYINKLKSEKEDWKKFAVRLKKEINQLQTNYSNIVDGSASGELLTNEDRQFLASRPDYVRVARLVDEAVECVALRRQRVTNTGNTVCCLALDCSRILDDLTAKLIDRTMRDFDEFHLKCHNKALDLTQYDDS